MSHAFIIGLPLPLKQRVEAAAKDHNLFITSILTDVAKEGGLRLLPHADVAASKLGAYFDSVDDYKDARVLVLPYTPIPKDVKNELHALKDLGGNANYAFAGKDKWPLYTRENKLNEDFLNAVFDGIKELFFPGETEVKGKPSEYFSKVAQRSQRFIITAHSLASCDEVAPHRYKFLYKSADVLSLFLSDDNATGRIEDFVSKQGLIHAQTGGIRVTLRVMREEQCVHNETTQTHLKQGDNTTRPAAARVYYQLFALETHQHIAILYAGPHPENDLTRVWSPP